MPATKLALSAALVGLLLLGGAFVFRTSNVEPGSSPAPCALSLATPSATATSQGSPAPTPVDTSTWVRFTSSRYGYSMCMPPDWTATNGPAPWVAIASNSGEAGAQDAFNAPAPQTSNITVTSQPLPADMTEDQWFALHSASVPANYPKECWPSVAAWGDAVVDGHQAALHGGLPQCNFTEVIVVSDGRVYDFEASPNPNEIQYQVFDWSQFYAFLDTVKLDPATADDSPTASPGVSPAASPR